MNKILPKHYDKAIQESDCFEKSIDMAKQFARLGNFKSAATHLENASRSLVALNDMRDMYKEAYTIRPEDMKGYL